MKIFKALLLILLISFVFPLFDLYPKTTRKYAKDYAVSEKNNAELDKEKKYVKRATKNEHPLARMQRVAHGYAYGDGEKEGGWDNKKFLTRIKADGFTVVETYKNSMDGAAAIVLRDDTTGKYIISIRGTDDTRDKGSDYKEAREGLSIGVQQYSNNKKIFKGMIDKYSSRSSDGKVIVAGHSLGAGVGNILSRTNPEKISKSYSFQGPGQTEKSADLFNQIPEDQRPEMILAVAAPDAVAYTGEKHPGNPKVYVAHSKKMAAGGSLFGHKSPFFQNIGMKDWKGENYISNDEHIAIAEMDFDEYNEFRKPFAFVKGETKAQWLKRWKKLGTNLSMTVIDKYIKQLALEHALGTYRTESKVTLWAPLGEIELQLERQVDLIRSEKKMNEYYKHLEKMIEDEDDPKKKKELQEDLALVKEMLDAMAERRKKNEHRSNYKELLEIWKKRLNRMLSVDKKKVERIKTLKKQIDILNKRIETYEKKCEAYYKSAEKSIQVLRKLIKDQDVEIRKMIKTANDFIARCDAEKKKKNADKEFWEKQKKKTKEMVDNGSFLHISSKRPRCGTHHERNKRIGGRKIIQQNACESAQKIKKALESGKFSRFSSGSIRCYSRDNLAYYRQLIEKSKEKIKVIQNEVFGTGVKLNVVEKGKKRGLYLPPIFKKYKSVGEKYLKKKEK